MMREKLTALGHSSGSAKCYILLMLFWFNVVYLKYLTLDIVCCVQN